MAVDSACVLSTYISDLNVTITGGGLSAEPQTSEGFAYLWGGVKATYGVGKGKVCFEVKLEKHLNVRHLPPDEPNPHVVRIGWSADSASLQLGEEDFSYGYGGTAKFSTRGQFRDYGLTFGAGDVITACLDYSSGKPVLSYWKNGHYIGLAFTSTNILRGKALFPHLLLKNTAVSVNFGHRAQPYFPVPEGYTLFGSLPVGDRVREPLAPATKAECDILMMVGLPGAGKSAWVEKHCKEHPEKRYYILGTNIIMDKMKVMGLRRERNYNERWEKLFQKANDCLHRFFEIAPTRKRNYILDQTNVYQTARERKMRPFNGFSRKAVVVVPTDDEYRRRIEKRRMEENKSEPESDILKMKKNFVLPARGHLFQDVIFVDLGRTDAAQLVARYNSEGSQRSRWNDWLFV
ncbi:heterogeneous nuclear ribonucleoprotein U-like protein 1 [Acanthaster planci]|uniref:Heterogeneous nuclear ribonucleoprotein U-like protein 1 n=1 Tax=Acanthaster planci TaxID=133434 RepID=A0A8B7YHC2_ACAPL|nr:heterogeneous nuclear ribonucleoprotein U-like protein 1 [Acanthaster planci]